jgi:LCP family protein required for cell wall assembly
MSRPVLDPGTGAYEFGRGSRGVRLAETLPPPLRRRRAFTLLALTVVAPGSAQLIAGNRTLGRVALRVWAAVWVVLLVTGVGLLVDRTAVLGLLARGPVLGVLQASLWGLAGLWAVLLVDAWRLGRPGTLVLPARRWLTAATAALLVATTGGLAYAASSVSAGRAALTAMFHGDRAVPPTEGRYNVLLLGADTGKGRMGTRPDSLQLASVDADTGKAVVFGFTRDTENIDFRPGSLMARLMPEGWNCGDQCLLNGLYTWAESNRAKFPASVREPGIEATREAVEALSGLHVHYYVMVDLKGFETLVDAVGGLDVTVARRTPIGGGTSRVTDWIEPGRQHLDGYHALWYARSREGSSNYERMARQRCVMTAMLGQLDPQTVLLRFSEIARAGSRILHTDLPQSELGYFADLATRTRSQPIRSVNFVPPLIKPWDYDPDVVTSTVARTIAESEKPAAKGSPTASRTPVSRPSGAATAGAGKPAPAAGTPRAAEADLASVCSAS